MPKVIFTYAYQRYSAGDVIDPPRMLADQLVKALGVAEYVEDIPVKVEEERAVVGVSQEATAPPKRKRGRPRKRAVHSD